MQLNSDVLKKVIFLVGNAEIAADLSSVPTLTPFSSPIIDFLNDVSREVMQDPRGKVYSDVITFGFWIRKASVLKLRERFLDASDSFIHLGKGFAFHIAPSNVPVNFAYSLVSGLLCGNINVVRVPSKDFPQIRIITDAFNRVLEKHENMKPYVFCIRYSREKEINDFFSSVADVRIVWGGDQTIAELRKSPLPPRSGEITFADRYSIAVIDSDAYLNISNDEKSKQRVAEDFYNDTFFSDQNACTSPRLIVWTGNEIEVAKEQFWKTEHNLVVKKYGFQDIMAVNKLTQGYLVAVNHDVKIEKHKDNLIVRVKVENITDDLMEYRDNSGYFYEYDCEDIMSLIPIVNNKHCQTIGYIGNPEMVKPLIESGLKGIDRIVPIGKTMDFDLIWDGYNLPALLTRNIVMV